MKGMKLLAAAFALVMALPAMSLMNVSSGEAFAADLSSMEDYPGVKHFNFASKADRSSVDEDCMIDPEYSIKMEKTMPDEYFGGTTTTKSDSSSGEVVTGFMLGKMESAKNQCGAICHNMFMYNGQWIDVKTTYVDWLVTSKLTGFFGGGFTRQRWRSVSWIEMKHEFFLAGTDTPVVIKGFQNYTDIDNKQGVMLEKSKLEDVWINVSDTRLTYDEVPADTDYTLESGKVINVTKDMLDIQTVTTEDIPAESEAGYDAETAAKNCVGFTFTGSVLHTCVTDGAPTGFNLLESGQYKLIPSALPEQGTPLIAKKVADADEEKGESNSVKPDEEWTYYVNAFVPEETESYNFYDGFRMEDEVNEHLEIRNVRMLRGEEDVGELFTIAADNNRVTAVAKDVDTGTFYGYDYIMEMVVGLKSDRKTLEEAGLIDENCCFKVKNIAVAVYGTGTEDREILTNETTTAIQFEQKADIVITKEIAREDVYSPHGEPVFLFRLSGNTSQGEKKEYNRCVRFDEEYVSGADVKDGKISRSVTFSDIPEGEYTCMEYDNMRFDVTDIKALSGGTVKGDTVAFTVDSGDTRSATFVNAKKDWSNYSHSSLVINKVVSGN